MGAISSILDLTPTTITADAQQKQKASKPFADFLSDASSSTTESSGSTRTDTGSTGVEEFMAYAKETPEERMFDTWLKSQNISSGEYKSMTTDQQQKLQNEFASYIKSRLDNKLGVGATATQTTATLPS